jgi:predicted GIY-YIG superfamily endonuclease
LTDNPGVPFVYILRCGDGSLYTGIAKDLDRRLAQHQAGQASRYTRSHLPVALVWARKVRSWSLALREERRIKAMRKAQKEEMLSSASRMT